MFNKFVDRRIRQPHAVEHPVGTIRAEKLLETISWFQADTQYVHDHIEIVISHAVSILGRVHLGKSCCHYQLLQIFDIRVDDAGECRAVFNELDFKHCSFGIPSNSVVANWPASFVEKFRCPPQVLPVKLALSGRRREHRWLAEHFLRKLIPQWVEEPEFRFAWQPGRGAVAVFPKRMYSFIQTVKKRLVRPFEIEHHAEGFTYSDISELIAPKIEHETLT